MSKTRRHFWYIESSFWCNFAAIWTRNISGPPFDQKLFSLSDKIISFWVHDATIYRIQARTMGMKYPRTGIIGDKPSVTDKSSYLIKWLEENTPNTGTQSEKDENGNA